MDPPSQPGDALAQPTRARLFALLGQLRRPAPTEELAQRLKLHPNGIRAHLERLSDAGLLTRQRQRQARGRPRDLWTINPDAQPGGQPPTAYIELGRWLVRAISAHNTPLGDIEATGRQIGRELAPPQSTTTPEAQMHATLVALGFQPQRQLAPDGQLTYCLANCPYRQAVHEHQAIVCTLHRGMTRGLLDTIDPHTTLTGFQPKDPDSAGCLIDLHGPLATEAAQRDAEEG